ALKRLALFLLSNTGNPVTANRLTGAMGIKSASTVLDYFSCRQLRILYHHPILHTQPDESICLKNNSIHNPSIISSYFQGCNYC
ncbi:MAG: hypothetical protein M0P01_15330, partial [Treponema sp.]|nr:hypothetical protein [Treponema sp.]